MLKLFLILNFVANIGIPPAKEDIIKTQKQFNCLVANVWHESRGENAVGMLFVAKTTLNRVHSEKFPKDICKVVFQKKQFSWTLKKKNRKPKPKNEIEEKALRSVVLLSSVAVMLDKLGVDFTNNSEYYHTKQVKPIWRKELERTFVIGDHIFYKNKENI